MSLRLSMTLVMVPLMYVSIIQTVEMKVVPFKRRVAVMLEIFFIMLYRNT